MLTKLHQRTAYMRSHQDLKTSPDLVLLFHIFGVKHVYLGLSQQSLEDLLQAGYFGGPGDTTPNKVELELAATQEALKEERYLKSYNGMAFCMRNLLD